MINMAAATPQKVCRSPEVRYAAKTKGRPASASQPKRRSLSNLFSHLSIMQAAYPATEASRKAASPRSPAKSIRSTLGVCLCEQFFNICLQTRQIGLYDLPHHVVPQSCLAVNDLIAESDDIADQGDSLPIARKMAQKLGKRFSNNSELALNARA